MVFREGKIEGLDGPLKLSSKEQGQELNEEEEDNYYWVIYTCKKENDENKNYMKRGKLMSRWSIQIVEKRAGGIRTQG